MAAFRFEILARDPGSGARAGLWHTPHGELPTPAFAPVGTQGAVKALSPADLTALGVRVVMCNAYHLAMRPGAQRVRALGGLHRLSGWAGPLMTDSGGFQVFSLEGLRKVDDEGVTFRSHIDGSLHRFTPESVVGVQEALGADLIMPLDVCTGYPAEYAVAERDVARTQRWLERSLAARTRPDQALYGIVQGGSFADLRAEAARAVVAARPDAFAIGGVSVGEPKEALKAAVRATLAELPKATPRHLLGVGHPDDLVDGIAAGVDTFDCVMPTRLARNATALTMAGRLNLRLAQFADDQAPIDRGCDCYACGLFSRGALRHFLKAGEILGIHLLTLHNLHFSLSLVRQAREAILAGRYEAFRKDFHAATSGVAWSAVA